MTPSPFILDNLRHAPAGLVLDIACGRGRHAIPVAQAGRRVHAIDRDWTACTALVHTARERALLVDIACADVLTCRFPAQRYAAVVNTLFLERRLLPHLIATLRPGGVLLFETFLREQLSLGHPRNPAFVLEPGELRAYASGLEVLAYTEGPVEREGTLSYLAALAARVPASP